MSQHAAASGATARNIQVGFEGNQCLVVRGVTVLVHNNDYF